MEDFSCSRREASQGDTAARRREEERVTASWLWRELSVGRRERREDLRREGREERCVLDRGIRETAGCTLGSLTDKKSTSIWNFQCLVSHEISFIKPA